MCVLLALINVMARPALNLAFDSITPVFTVARLTFDSQLEFNDMVSILPDLVKVVFWNYKVLEFILVPGIFLTALHLFLSLVPTLFSG